MKRLDGKKIGLVFPNPIAHEVRLLKTARVLVDAGAQVTVIVDAPQNVEMTELDGFCEVIRLPLIQRLPIEPSRFGRLGAYVRSRRQARIDRNLCEGIADEIMQRDFDIVHFVNYIFAPEILRIKESSDIKVVYETYEDTPRVLEYVTKSGAMTPELRDHWIAEERKAVAIADSVVVVSEEIKGRYACLTDAEKIFVVFNAAPEMPILPTEVAHPLRFYCQTGIRPYYGIEELIKAFKGVSADEAILAIQGPWVSDAYRDTLHDLIIKSGVEDRVELIEPCDMKDVVVEANQYDVGLFAAPTMVNGQYLGNTDWSAPNRLFAYTSAGLALLFGHYQGIEAFAGKDTPFIRWMDQSDVSDIAEHIRFLVAHPDEVTQMKQAAFEWAEDWSVEKAEIAIRKAFTFSA